MAQKNLQSTIFNLQSIVTILVALIGFGIFIIFFEQVFPTASLDLRIDRKEAIQTAQRYLQSLGYDTSGYQSSVVLEGNHNKFVFIEKCIGLKAANEKTREEIPQWYWEVRFFKELEKEGFTVQVNPIGRIDGFSYHVNDNAPLETVSQEEALQKAAAFLATQNIDIALFEKIEASSVTREARVDHHFAWKKKGSELTWTEKEKTGTGMIRISVDIYGSRVGAFQSYFWIPEVFERYVHKLFSEGGFLALISMFFYMILYVCALIMFIMSFRQAALQYRVMIVVALLMAVPHILNVINTLPLIKAGYDTNVQSLVYYGSEIIGSLRGILNQTMVIVIVFCGGIYCAQRFYGNRISGLLAVLEGRITRDVRREVYGGYIFACIVLGFVTLFYYIGMTYCGVWVFPSPRYANFLGTWFPFLLPLSFSIAAAVSEEFVFRMFAISFLKKIVRITALAVLIPGVIWAFAHSSYAVFPVYTRGIELTIVACGFSFVFLRYGIVTAIVAHYVIDAILFSMPLLRSSDPYFLVSGYVVIGLALLPMMIGVRRGR